MPRINCSIVSPGKQLRITAVGVGTSWTTIAEAPDFSLPDPSGTLTPRDPNDDGRYIAPGLVSFLRPIMVRNRDAVERWVEFQLLNEDNVAVAVPGRLPVPPGATVAASVQGLDLMKRVAEGFFGDRLQVRAEVVSMLDLWGAAQETQTDEHEGVYDPIDGFGGGPGQPGDQGGGG